MEKGMVVVEHMNEKGQVVRAIVPPGTHLVLMTDQMAAQIFSRTNFGWKLTYTRGKQEPEGWYVPTVTQEDDGYVLVNKDHIEHALRTVTVTLRDGYSTYAQKVYEILMRPRVPYKPF